jgi:hypothetical protein
MKPFIFLCLLFKVINFNILAALPLAVPEMLLSKPVSSSYYTLALTENPSFYPLLFQVVGPVSLEAFSLLSPQARLDLFNRALLAQKNDTATDELLVATGIFKNPELMSLYNKAAHPLKKQVLDSALKKHLSKKGGLPLLAQSYHLQDMAEAKNFINSSLQRLGKDNQAETWENLATMMTYIYEQDKEYFEAIIAPLLAKRKLSEVRQSLFFTAPLSWVYSKKAHGLFPHPLLSYANTLELAFPFSTQKTAFFFKTGNFKSTRSLTLNTQVYPGEKENPFFKNLAFATQLRPKNLHLHLYSLNLDELNILFQSGIAENVQLLEISTFSLLNYYDLVHTIYQNRHLFPHLKEIVLTARVSFSEGQGQMSSQALGYAQRRGLSSQKILSPSDRLSEILEQEKRRTKY